MNITSKILLSIITGTCLVSFTACGSSDSNNQSSQQVSAQRPLSDIPEGQIFRS